MTAQRYEPAADLGSLVDHPRNPRVGRDEAVAGSIDANGFYGAIVAQESTRTILAGHTRRRTLAARGEQTAPVIWVDCDDETALRILLADNRTAELAVWDEAALIEVLGAVPDLGSVGFTEHDLEAMLKRATPASATAAEEFPSYDDESIKTEHVCPRCGYSWSGGATVERADEPGDD